MTRAGLRVAKVRRGSRPGGLGRSSSDFNLPQPHPHRRIVGGAEGGRSQTRIGLAHPMSCWPAASLAEVIQRFEARRPQEVQMQTCSGEVDNVLNQCLKVVKGVDVRRKGLFGPRW
uniref:Uncharacterized protein n=1 Tax=Sphaerodactylus townsendi TaxID=933632 RepID=A0ACB8F0Q2_9SAUR